MQEKTIDFLRGQSYEILKKMGLIHSAFLTKEMSFCHKLKFVHLYIFAIQCRRPFIFQTINYVRSNGLSLKYQRFTSSGWKDIGFSKFEFVAKTQFLLAIICVIYLYMIKKTLMIITKFYFYIVKCVTRFVCVLKQIRIQFPQSQITIENVKTSLTLILL